MAEVGYIFERRYLTNRSAEQHADFTRCPGRLARGISAHPSRWDAERDAVKAGKFTLNSPDHMIANNFLSTFHQWLLAEPTGPAPARTIILHGDFSVFSDRLIEEIATYLNEYDDDGAGRWLSATSELVRQISENPNLRQLLGLGKSSPNFSPEGPCDLLKSPNRLGAARPCDFSFRLATYQGSRFAAGISRGHRQRARPYPKVSSGLQPGPHGHR